jgi:hypothetical protein
MLNQAATPSTLSACPNCKADLTDSGTVAREYINKDDGKPSAFALGRYDNKEFFVSERFDGFGDGRYDLCDNSDFCTCCDKNITDPKAQPYDGPWMQ